MFKYIKKMFKKDKKTIPNTFQASNNNKIETFDENVKIKAAKYKVVLWDGMSGSMPRMYTKPFMAERYRSEEDNVVYLRNTKKKFKEIFPEQVNDFKNYSETELDELIRRTEKAIRKERREDDPNVNDRDLEMELMILKSKKRSFKFSDNSSYLSADDVGTPTFNFVRKGSTFFPLKWDINTSFIFTPSDNRKKSASILLRNKENKYSKYKKLIEGGTIAFFIMSLILAAAAGWGFYEAYDLSKQGFQDYEATAIAQAQRRSLEVANECAIATGKSAQANYEVIKAAEEKINKPPTIVEGLLPK